MSSKSVIKGGIVETRRNEKGICSVPEEGYKKISIF